MARDRREYFAFIVEMADRIERRLATLDWNQFIADHDEIDLAAFRLMQIGEASRKLPEDIRVANPQIAWTSMYAMRNIISHDYLGIDEALVWHAAKNELTALVILCRNALDDNVK